MFMLLEWKESKTQKKKKKNRKTPEKGRKRKKKMLIKMAKIKRPPKDEAEKNSLVI